jgi:hypothetical protein
MINETPPLAQELPKEKVVDSGTPIDTSMSGGVQVAGGLTPLMKELFKRGAKDLSENVVKKAPLYKSKKDLAETVVKPKETVSESTDAVVDETVEANRVLDLDFGEFKQLDDHQINFDMIDTTDDIKAVIGSVAQDNKGTINAARRNKISHDQLQVLADELGTDQQVIEQVMKRQAGEAFGPEVILAARQVLGSSAKRILTLAEKVRTGGATQKEMLQFRRQLDFHREYQGQLMGARAEAGRALNAFGIPTGDDPRSVARLSELVETTGGAQDLMRTAQELEHIDSIEGLNKLTKTSRMEKVQSVLVENFINSILSGVKTHVINTSGNALFQGMNVAETAVAARIGKFMGTEEGVAVGEASAMMYGKIYSWRQALKAARVSFKSGEPSDQVMKFEGTVNKAISADNLELSGGMGRAVDLLGTIIRSPTERIMLPVDEMFKVFARNGDIARQAFREADRAASLSGNPQDTGKIIQEFMRNPPQQAIDEAQAAALYSTFQNPLGEAGQAVQKAINKVPGARFVAPFIRTPINIFKAGLLERSPVAVFTKKFQQDIKAGGADRDMALARVSMGSITAGSVGLFAANGQITGGGPSNFKAREALKATGWKPYSIVANIDGKTVYQSYQRAEPLAYVIGAVADFVEIQNYGDDQLDTDDEQVSEITAAIVAAIAENTTNKTFLQGVSDFTHMMDDPKRYLASWGNNLISAQVPFSGARRDLTRIQDPYARTAWELTDKIKASSGFPGYTEEVPANLDLYGDPKYHPSGSILGIMSPFPDSTQTTDEVKLEVVRVMKASRTVPIGKPAKRIDGVKLSTKEYYDLTQLSRKIIEDGEGNNFHEALDDVMNSAIYADSTPDMRATLLKEVQRNFDQWARAELEAENDDLKLRLETRRAKKDMLMFGIEELDSEQQDLLDKR